MNQSSIVKAGIVLVVLFFVWFLFNLNVCGVERAQPVESRPVATEEIPTPATEEIIPEETPEPETVTVWHLWYNGEAGWTHEKIANIVRVDIGKDNGVLELTTDGGDTRYINGNYYLKSTEEVVK